MEGLFTGMRGGTVRSDDGQESHAEQVFVLRVWVSFLPAVIRTFQLTVTAGAGSCWSVDMQTSSLQINLTVYVLCACCCTEPENKEGHHTS